MKKNSIFCLILVLSLLLGTFGTPAKATEITGTHETTGSQETTGEQTQPGAYDDTSGDSSVANGCHSLNGQMPLWGNGKLLETAGAAMLYEVNSDTILYGWNPDEQMHPASLVKIMTLLIAVEQGDLSEKITVTANALAAMPPKSTLNFKVGEVWTLEEYLYCLMVGNYSDAAVVIAEHIAGSQKGFLNMMNKRAEEIGCTGTYFANPTGFHDASQVTTARDMVKILREAIKNEKFFPFFSETIYRLPANDLSESRYMETTNYMMTLDVTPEYYDSRVTGGRTGVTEDRRRCLIVTAESKGLHYIAIVLGAVSIIDQEEATITRFGSYEEVKELLKMGFDGYKVTQVLNDDQTITQYAVSNGENSVTVGPSNTCYTVLPEGITSQDLSFRYEQTLPSLNAPVEAGQYITSVQVWYGNVCVAQSPIITRNSSRLNTEGQDNDTFLQTGGGVGAALWVIGILAAGIVVFAGGLYVIRFLRTASIRAQHRRRRRNRRRSR